MVDFKLNIGHPKTKKTYKVDLADENATKLVGLKIGDKFHGELAGLAGYELEVTGGSDIAGFPMRKGLHSQGRKKILTQPGVGFTGIKKNKKKLKVRKPGIRKKKTVCGEVISEEIVQINCKVVKDGKESMGKLLGVEQKAEAVDSKEKQSEEAPVKEKE